MPPFWLGAQSLAYPDSVFTAYFERTAGWTAGDATISVPTPEGKSLWLFGDSHINDYDPEDSTISCLFQVRNALMVQDILNPSDFRTILDDGGTGVGRTPVKPSGADGTLFWPGHGYAKRDTAIVFWFRYNAALDLQGSYYTKIRTRGLEDASGIGEPQKVPWTGNYEFGNAVVVDSSDQYIYIYGQKKDWIILRPYVARLPIDQDISGPWEFYNGADWTTEVDQAAQIMGTANDYVSASYSVMKLQGKYYMISQEIGFLECGLGREIYSWESEMPQGPFTNKKLLYTIEDSYQSQYWITYNATAHPEFIKDNELLISYNLNGVCDPPECEDVFSDTRKAVGYRPKFIRVPLDLIDPELNVPDPVFPKILPLGTGKKLDLRVFPNPAIEGSFCVYFPSKGQNEVVVYNLAGDLVLKCTTGSGELNLRLSRAGLYLLNVRSGEITKQVKVMVR